MERSPVNRTSAEMYSLFLLTDPTNPADNLYPRITYENLHHEALSEEDLEALETLPYIDAVDKRYMTAGVSEDYLRKERRTAMEGTITPDCRRKCTGCGINRCFSEVRCDE